MIFHDRSEAGRRLSVALQNYRDARPVVLALPRGGVPVAAEIAAALDAPLDLILVRKIGTPGQPELAMGAVVDGAALTVVRNEEVIGLTGIQPDAFEAACQREMAEIERRRQRYFGGAARPDIAGRVAIVVDDGIATGATVKAALRATRKRKPQTLVLAVPVAPAEAIDELRGEADEVLCLEMPHLFDAVGRFYRDFRQVSDEEVTAALARFRL
ncbi:phosphoribosyltransferase [Rhodoligotrophos defluvii]|uniref:phosphoribosyltransferase n=1 Tax=Rhodoligotrophos defluvii TaxID=2561934 RepID=UPI0010C99D24|nr:phosphoribosyltransferase [Rhodoligotrophos defluvii]